MRHFKNLSFAIIGFALLLIGSCSDDSSENQPQPTDPSSENLLVSMSFKSNLNPHINSDINTNLSGSMVSGIIPFGKSLQLIPTFQVSNFASVKIDNMEVSSGESSIDFSSQVSMTVIAENGDENQYTIDIKDSYESLDARIENLMSQFNIPGVQIAILRDERLVYQRPYGLSNNEENLPVTNQSLFRIASISKPITSIAIFKLAQDNMLDLDDLVFGEEGLLGTKYGTTPYPSDVEQITVRHLLDHTSGWTNNPFDPMFNNLSYTHGELISDMIDNRPLVTSPGSTYYYSNFGYCVLGRIVEEVSNLPYAQYVTDDILNPIGVSKMNIAGNTLSEQYPDEVQYYDQENFSPYIMNVSRMDSHGGWIASATDLAKFLVHTDRNTSKSDIVSANYLNQSYFGYSNWIFYGSLPGTSSGISRINDNFGYTFLINTRTIPVIDILDAMNEILRDEILSISEWPEYDLFDE